MWTHKKLYKGKEFFGCYEFSKKKGKRVLKFKNAKTGKEISKEYGNGKQAKADSWVYKK